MKTVMLMLLVLLSGCSGLALRDTDTSAETTGKVAARVVLAPVTLGMSELRMYEIRLEEGCRTQGLPYNRMAHDCGFTQPLSIGDGLAAAALIQGMNQNLQSMHVPPQPMPTLQPMLTFPIQPVRPQTNCTSYMVGHQINTSCY